MQPPGSAATVCNYCEVLTGTLDLSVASMNMDADEV